MALREAHRTTLWGLQQPSKSISAMDREEEPEQNEDQEAGERRVQETLTGGIEIEYDEYDNDIDDVIKHE